MRTILLIGLQVDMLPGGGAEVPESQGLISVVNELVPLFDLVVAANFWLPATHGIFAANHPWRRPGQAVEVGGHPVFLQNFFCIQNSFGAEFMPGIDTRSVAFTAQMGTHADLPPHSAFFEADKKTSTGLARYLLEKNVAELFIVGMPIETTILFTALDAVELGFEVSVFGDRCGAVEVDNRRQILTNLEKAGVKLL